MSFFAQEQKQQEPIVQEEKETCSICLDDVTKKGSVTLDCGHEFHLKCWMQLKIEGGANKDKCPNCRADQDVPSIRGGVNRNVNGNNVQNPMEYLMNMFPNIPPRIVHAIPRPRAVLPFNQRIARIIGVNGKTVQEVKEEFGASFSEAFVRNQMNAMVRGGELVKWRQGRAYMYVRV